jgi:hypothetical protein
VCRFFCCRFCVAVAVVARAVAFAFDLSSRKASRAPQAEMAEEARVSERSEFPRRPQKGMNAISAQERRGPAAQRRIASRRRRFCFLLPRQKEVAPSGAKAFDPV